MARPTFKYLPGEGKRNRSNADLFLLMLCIAWEEDCQVMTGHHIGFMFDADLSTQDEIPAADTLLFDHEVMAQLFPQDYQEVMLHLATLRRYERENYIRKLLCQRYPEHKLDNTPRFAEAA
jgi:hypothetical protein